MNKYQYELLAQIKRRFIETNGILPFQTAKIGENESARQFYLKHLDDNLVRPMDAQHTKEYSQGSGSELDDKMKALRSSSAMTFNILGNLHCHIKDPDDLFRSHSYSIQYEYQIPTLKSGLPANLDVLLSGESEDIVACEMKMLEWLTSKPAKLKEKYLDPDNYIHLDTAPVFTNVARILNTIEVLTHYDFAQMFKHTLALYNASRSRKLETHRLTLMNCVWEPPTDYEFTDGAAEWIAKSIASEHMEFHAFSEIMNPIYDLFANDRSMEFTIQYIPAANMIASLEYTKEENQKLKRYL